MKKLFWFCCHVCLLGTSGFLANDRVLTHFPSESGGFTGTLVLVNNSYLPKKMELDCFDQNGEFLARTPFNLQPKQIFEVAVIDSVPERTSHAFLHGSDRVKAAIAYGVREGVVRAMVKATVSQRGRVRISPSILAMEDNYWEGAAVVNCGDEPGYINVDLMIDGIKGPPGRAFWVPARGKVVFLFEGLFTPTEETNSFYYQISSNLPFAVTGLAGINDHSITWSALANSDSEFPRPLFSESSVTDLQEDSYVIKNISLDEEIMSLTLQLPNDCDENVTCYVSGDFMESSPAQVNVTFQRRVAPGSVCLEVLTEKQYKFDLSFLVEAYKTRYGREDTFLINVFSFNGESVSQLVYKPIN